MSKSLRYAYGMTVAMLALTAANLMAGSEHIPVSEVWNILSGVGSDNESWLFIVREIRLPQIVTAILCGASLATSGLMLQTAFRNPLAGPSVFGITNGAGVGVAVVMLLFGGTLSTELLALNGFVAVLAAAFAGAMTVTAVIFLFSTIVRNNVMLLIIGIMVGYLSSSVIALLNFSATEEGVRSYMIWGMGSFANVSMAQLPIFTIAAAIGLVCALLMIKPLNTLLLGEQYAENLGINLRRTRNLLLVVTGMLTATATAFCGPVAFIGLAVPHITRLLLRTENHRSLLPLTMLTGSTIALLCNLISTLPGKDGIIPLNAVTPLIGAPVIIYVITSKKLKS